MNKQKAARTRTLLSIGALALLAAGAARAEATVVFVAPDATGDSTSWESPTTFESAMAMGASQEVEVWMKEGVYTKTEDSAKYVFNKPVTVRGGFAGTETSADGREAGKYSTVDGQDAWNTFEAEVNQPAEFERVVFTRSRERGFVKSKNGSLTLKDCQFVRNGITASGSNRYGYGAYVGGNSGSTEVVIDGCRFDRNAVTNMVNDMGSGFGLFLEGAKAARIVDCSFDENGYAHSLTNRMGNRTWPTALTVKNAAVAVTNCSFVGNSFYAGGACAIVRLQENCGGSSFDHCVFKGNRIMKGNGYDESSTSAMGTFNVEMKSASQAVKIASCTFAYNISATVYSSAGLNVIAGTANVRDSIFYGNLIPASSGSGENDVMVVGASGAANLSYTMVDHVPATATCEGLVVGVPQFVTPLEDFLSYVYVSKVEATYPRLAMDPREMTFKGDDETHAAVMAMDVHLLSKAGYFKNDGVEYSDTDAFSRAIDSGDPASAFASEGSPNGGRVNLGVYGNTAQAAKSVVGQPALASDDVTIEWLDGYTQPKVTATLGGDGDFNASVTILMSLDGAGYEKVYEAGGVRSGESVSWTYQGYLDPSAHLYVTVVATASGASEVTAAADCAASGELPPWHGKGGDAEKVIHVRPGANGKKDGTSWTDAYDSWVQALKAMTATRSEVWVAGTNVVDQDMATLQPSFHFAIRGGFDGSENSADERKDGVVSGADGADVYNTLSFETSKTSLLERVLFMRGKQRGVYRAGNGGALVMKDCRILMNGLKAGNISGRGVYVKGNTSTDASFERCSFEGNIDGVPSYDAGSGYGLYLEGLGKATLTDCAFLTNGVRFTQANFSHRSLPTILHAVKTPVFATNCTFLANRTSGSTNGGVTYLTDNCDGSVFDHCAWVGNSIFKTNDGWKENATSQMSVLGIALGDLSRTVEMNGCTVAYNLSCSTYNAAGIDVHSGTLNLRNSIVYGNLVPASSTAADADLAVVGDADKAAANVSWTLMDHEPAAATCENMVVGAPLFVTPVEDFVGLVYTNTTAEAKFTEPAEFPKVNVLPKDMRFRWDGGVFEAVLGLDVHNLSRAGYYKNDGLRYKDAKATSPAVDAGDPATYFRNELAPNGRRVNLGFYGNTAEAAHSPGGFVISIR